MWKTLTVSYLGVEFSISNLKYFRTWNRMYVWCNCSTSFLFVQVQFFYIPKYKSCGLYVIKVGTHGPIWSISKRFKFCLVFPWNFLSCGTQFLEKVFSVKHETSNFICIKAVSVWSEYQLFWELNICVNIPLPSLRLEALAMALNLWKMIIKEIYSLLSW